MQKLGINHGGYRGERIDISSVLAEIKTAGVSRNGWISETFGKVEDFDLVALRHLPSASVNKVSRIYISAGIHGDEPAGPLAALRLLQEGAWPQDTEIVLVPCLNPVGFKNNQRENGRGIDLNRDYLHLKSTEVRTHVEWLKGQPPFDACFCLHEDWESLGFYLYELNPSARSSRAKSMIAAAATVCPIDMSPVIETRAARGGIISPSLDPQLRPLWPESFWLLQNKTRLAYTLEAPSDFNLQIRVEALVAAVNAGMSFATG
jgi:murein peptide amidase A